MPKYDVGELITALNEAVNKLNNLRVKYDDLEKERDALRAALKEYDDAFEDWFLFVEGRKDDPNEETKACTRLVKAQRVARAALGEKE